MRGAAPTRTSIATAPRPLAGRMTSAMTSASDAWPRIGATPAELVFEVGALRVLRYRPTTGPVSGPPFLLVMPVINKSYVVDLTPNTSLVGALQAAGVDTYLVDWGTATLADRNRGLDALVTRILPRIEAAVLAASGSKQLVLAGYCLGGTIAVCRAAHASKKPEHASRYAGLVTFHTPVSFADAGPLGTLTAPENFPVDAILAAFGNMPGWLLQQGFGGNRPSAIAAKYRRLLDKSDDKDAVEEFIALEKWNSDNVPVTGAFYERLIKDLYRGDKLAKGELTIDGAAISMKAIRCPVLALCAKDDAICLPHQARALVDAVSSDTTSCVELTGGHVRSLTGPKARHAVAKTLAAWIAERAAR